MEIKEIKNINTNRIDIISDVLGISRFIARLINSYTEHKCCALISAVISNNITKVVEILKDRNEAKAESYLCELHNVPGRNGSNKNREDGNSDTYRLNRLEQMIPHANLLFPFLREKDFDYISHAAFLCGLHGRFEILFEMGNYFGKNRLQTVIFGCAISGHYYYIHSNGKKFGGSKKLLVSDSDMDSSWHLIIPDIFTDGHYVMRQFSCIRGNCNILYHVKDIILILAICNNRAEFQDKWQEKYHRDMRNRNRVYAFAYIVMGDDENALKCLRSYYDSFNPSRVNENVICCNFMHSGKLFGMDNMERILTKFMSTITERKT